MASRTEKLQLLALLEEKARRQHVYRYRRFGDSLYGWQRQLIRNTAAYYQTCLVAANRIGKCVGGNTLIETDGGRVKVVDLDASRHRVKCRIGEEDAFAEFVGPFSKGIHDSYLVKSESGEFIAADYHRMLVSDVWTFPVEFYVLSQGHPSFVRSLVASMLECDQLAHVSDVLHSSGKAQGCLDDCSCYRHQCDGQLHASEAGDRASFPSRADVLLRILAWFALGVLVRKSEHSPCELRGLLSSLDEGVLSEGQFVESLFLAGSKYAELSFDQCRVVWLLGAVATSHLRSIGGLLVRCARESLASCAPWLPPFDAANNMLSVTYIGRDEVFDISVPGAGNYYAHGVLHHNTRTGTYIDAVHALGHYPDWWDGHAFDHAPLIWCLGYSGEKTRDLLQTPIFGMRQDDGWAGGLIPPEYILEHEAMTGTPNAMRSVYVRHGGGGDVQAGAAKVQFWSYSQGQHAIMGDSVDFFHIDEEPKDQAIYPQVLTRTATGDKGRGGRGILTFTPENGRTELVIKFMDDPGPGQIAMNAGWDDAPHLTEEVKTTLLASYPEHQREMRTKGIPMLGHGRIYDLAEEFITCDPFEIPAHWMVIDGMDFGWDHPQAHVQLAIDLDNDAYYVVQAFKAPRISPSDAWSSVRRWAKGVPTAWPLDGLQTEKGSGKQQRDYYVEADFDMIHEHATWPDGGNGVEAGLFEITDLMRKGRFKVFRGLRDWFGEFLQYHRDERGKIVKVNDDLMDACFAPETLVMTPSGAIRIDEMEASGEVIGINGDIYGYDSLGITRRNSDMVAVHLSDGSIVKCTPDHKWLTPSGWMRADTLCDNMDVITSEDIICTQSLNSMELVTENSANIGEGRAISYIAQSGHFIMERFRKVITSITKMAIRTITALKT